jgi:hypothetical protein
LPVRGRELFVVGVGVSCVLEPEAAVLREGVPNKFLRGLFCQVENRLMPCGRDAVEDFAMIAPLLMASADSGWRHTEYKYV